MDDKQAWNDLLIQYKDDPEKLVRTVGELTEIQLGLCHDEESWTIREITHHVIDGDLIWTLFIKQALGGQDSPFDLSWYWEISQDEWADKWGYSKRALGPALDFYRANRVNIIEILYSVSKPWQHSLLIPFPSGKDDTWSMMDAIEWNMKHTQDHLKDIHRILDTNI